MERKVERKKVKFEEIEDYPVGFYSTFFSEEDVKLTLVMKDGSIRKLEPDLTTLRVALCIERIKPSDIKEIKIHSHYEGPKGGEDVKEDEDYIFELA